MILGRSVVTLASWLNNNRYFGHGLLPIAKAVSDPLPALAKAQSRLVSRAWHSLKTRAVAAWGPGRGFRDRRRHGCRRRAPRDGLTACLENLSRVALPASGCHSATP